MNDIIYYNGQEFVRLPKGEIDKVLPERYTIYWYEKVLKILEYYKIGG